MNTCRDSPRSPLSEGGVCLGSCVRNPTGNRPRRSPYRSCSDSCSPQRR
jgi:hypothetical protein